MGKLINWREQNKYKEKEPLKEEVFEEKEQCEKCGGRGMTPDECENCEGVIGIILEDGEAINCTVCEETGEVNIVCDACSGERERKFEVIKRKPVWSAYAS